MTGTTQLLNLDMLQQIAVDDQIDVSQRWVLRAMQRHGRELVTMLWRILGNEQDVCDIYQTTFLHLAHHAEPPRLGCVKAYVFRSASNAAISLLRSRMAERRRVQTVVQSEPWQRSPEYEMDQKSLIEKLRFYISRLPEHLQDVVVLRDLAEMSYSQISRTLGISTGTARVYRCKAVQLLAVWMNTERTES